ncbi:hypothetical protein [Histidinibacterium aquaticum]|uniref:Uncharacterized protein n=1 Tax=Histidinibacterium aquaticum TaxID=2613962 RepID=A0A5J5GNU8_9RHOB|nr:hypothetical protein [Histidinibacterium aquaticum]KAA9009238.1 hypothetical protein F3S47_08270 [Histidinibacterium aquaticum]
MPDLTLSPPVALFASGLLFIFAALVLAVRGPREPLRRRVEAMRGRVAFPGRRVARPPEAADVRELREIVQDLMERERWSLLARCLALLSNGPSDATDGQRLYDVAMDAATARVREAENLGDLPEALAPHARAAETGEPALTALHCRAMAAAILRAEAEAGEAGRALAQSWTRDIEQALDRHDLEIVTVPCLAEAAYHARACATRDPEALDRAFRDWVEADRGNARPYVHHARRLAALGPPGVGALSRHLGLTVAARRIFGGPGPLLRVQLAAAGSGPLAALPGWCRATLMARLSEVSEGPGGQDLVNAVCAKVLADGEDALAQDILRNYLRVKIASHWPDGEAFDALCGRALGAADARRSARALQETVRAAA